MFQFAGFASSSYGFTEGYRFKRWVAPFGHPRINERSPLPWAFRSVPRPSSPLGAKASTRCPSLAKLAHVQPQARKARGRQRTDDRGRTRRPHVLLPFPLSALRAPTFRELMREPSLMPRASASIPMSIRHGRRPARTLTLAPGWTCLPRLAVTTLSARCQISELGDQISEHRRLARASALRPPTSDP
jgi:hypothetical protein